MGGSRKKTHRPDSPPLDKLEEGLVSAFAGAIAEQMMLDEQKRKEAISAMRPPEGPHPSVMGRPQDADKKVADNATAHVTSMPTAEEMALEETESKWMEGLKNTPTGKKLCDYLGHLMSVLDDGSLSLECPIDQAVSFRRVLIRALERNANPFNLPKTLPKFIAMVQLCGERMLLTTEYTQLFQLLAHSTSGPRANTDAIQAMVQMIKYQKEHPECSLLLTYSAPFQVSLEHLWWDVRTIKRDPQTLTVIDGDMAYQIGQGKCRPIGCTSTLESDISAGVLDQEIKTFAQHVTAIDLDAELLISDVEDSGESTSHRVATLEGLLARMQSDRKKMEAQHAEEISQCRSREATASAASNEAAKVAYQSERDHEASLNREVTRLATEVEASLAAVAKHKTENDKMRKEFRAEENAEVLRLREDRSKLEAKLASAETSSKQATAELSRSNKARETALKKLETGHQKSLDAAERKFSRLQMTERAAKQEAEQYLSKLTALSTAMEGRDSEKELLQHKLHNMRNANKVLRGFLALAGVRQVMTSIRAIDEYTLDETLRQLDEANGRLRVHELSASTSNVEVKKLQDLVRDLTDERDGMDKANTRLQQRVKELEATPPSVTLADAPKFESSRTPLNFKSSTGTERPVPEDLANHSPSSFVCGRKMQDADTMTVPITSKADLRLGELETKCVKLQGELEASQNDATQLKAELARAIKKNKKGAFVEEKAGASPVLGVPSANSNGYNQVVNVHVGNGAAGNSTAVASTDLGHTPDVDPSVEHLIAQAATHLRILADAARDSARHKQAACEGWARYNALHSYTGYQAPQLLHGQQHAMHAQPQLPLQAHPHPSNGYHMGM